MDRWRWLQLILGGITLIGFIFGVLNFIAKLKNDLLDKINAGLTLLPNCGFSADKTTHIHGVLLESLKKLSIEDNYETAKNLYNSVSNDLYFCKPLLQADPYLMLLTLVGLFGIFLIISGLRRTRPIKNDDSQR